MANQYGEGGTFTVRMEGPFGSTSTPINVVSVSAPLSEWKGAISPFSQVIFVPGVTATSKIDLQLGYEQLNTFRDQEIAFVAENVNGEVTLYAIGEKPKADVNLQATLTEVVVSTERIIGDVATTTVPRPDYNQTDPEKGDFIKNKPTELIESIRKTANAAMPKAGGKFTGEVDMNENKIVNVPAPEKDTDAVNKKFVTDQIDNTHLSKTVTATVAGWTGDSAPYTQTIAVEGVMETDNPHYCVVYSEDADTRQAEKEAFSLVDELETADGSITFTCFEDKPEVDLNIQLEVNR